MDNFAPAEVLQRFDYPVNQRHRNGFDPGREEQRDTMIKVLVKQHAHAP